MRKRALPLSDARGARSETDARDTGHPECTRSARVLGRHHATPRTAGEPVISWHLLAKSPAGTTEQSLAPQFRLLTPEALGVRRVPAAHRVPQDAVQRILVRFILLVEVQRQRLLR